MRHIGLQAKRVITAIVPSARTWQYLDTILSKVLAGTRQALQAEAIYCNGGKSDTGKPKNKRCLNALSKPAIKTGFLLFALGSTTKSHRL